MKRILVVLAVMVTVAMPVAAWAEEFFSPEEKSEIKEIIGVRLPGKPVAFYDVRFTGNTRVVVGDTWEGIYLEFEIMPADGAVREVWSRPGHRHHVAPILSAVLQIIDRPAREALGRNLLK